jgi:hypothetical protein
MHESENAPREMEFGKECLTAFVIDEATGKRRHAMIAMTVWVL